MGEIRARAAGFALLLAAPALGQEQERVEVRVTFVSGSSVFLDQGREAGLAPGDEVTLRPPGMALLRARIESVARASARVELGALQTPPTGTPGEVLVPADRRRGAATTRSAPSHGPWPEPVTTGQGDLPLLAPVLVPGSSRPLPTALHGRLYGNTSTTFDRGSDRHHQYLFNRAGADVSLERPFLENDALRFAGEYTRSDALLQDVPDVSEQRARLDRLSYGLGGRTRDPGFVQFGRFPQEQVPELGLLDGAEGALRLAPEWHAGMSLGAMPDAFGHGGSGDDLAAAAFLRFQPGPALDSTLAYQRTWHKGDHDRDLFLASADGSLGDSFTWHGGAWVDWYHGEDQIKSHGLQLTQLLLSASWLLDRDNGLNASAAHTRWPELLRDEFAPMPPDRIRNSRVDSGSLGGWHRFDAHWRADGRVTGYTSDLGSALGGDVRLAARDLIADGNEVSVQALWIGSVYLEGPGLRLAASQSFGSVFATLTYDLTRLDARDLGGDVTLVQQMVSGTLDLPLGGGWHAAFNADQRFGDGQDALTLGGTLQVRF